MIASHVIKPCTHRESIHIPLLYKSTCIYTSVHIIYTSCSQNKQSDEVEGAWAALTLTICNLPSLTAPPGPMWLEISESFKHSHPQEDTKQNTKSSSVSGRRDRFRGLPCGGTLGNRRKVQQNRTVVVES